MSAAPRGVSAPRELSELPFAAYLEPFQGELGREAVLDTVHVDGKSFDDVEAGGSRVSESALTSVVFAGGRMRRARFTDVWAHSVRWVATDLAETAWMDVEVVAGSLAGLEMFSSAMRRVVFHNCKLDSVNLRAADLRDVTFADCLLRDVDFGGAGLDGVSFPGSDLDGVRFPRARMKNVDLSGAVRLEISEGIDALRGATINNVQMMDLAPVFAQVLGIGIKDG